MKIPLMEFLRLTFSGGSKVVKLSSLNHFIAFCMRLFYNKKEIDFFKSISFR